MFNWYFKHDQGCKTNYLTYHKFKQDKWECSITHYNTSGEKCQNVIKHSGHSRLLESVAEHSSGLKEEIFIKKNQATKLGSDEYLPCVQMLPLKLLSQKLNSIPDKNHAKQQTMQMSI